MVRDLLELASLARMGLVTWCMKSTWKYCQITESQRGIAQCRENLIQAPFNRCRSRGSEKPYANWQASPEGWGPESRSPNCPFWVHSKTSFFQSRKPRNRESGWFENALWGNTDTKHTSKPSTRWNSVSICWMQFRVF